MKETWISVLYSYKLILCGPCPLGSEPPSPSSDREFSLFLKADPEELVSRRCGHLGVSAQTSAHVGTTRVPSALVSAGCSSKGSVIYRPLGTEDPWKARGTPGSSTSLPCRSWYLRGTFWKGRVQSPLPSEPDTPSPSQSQELSSEAHCSFNVPLPQGQLASVGSASKTVGNPIAFRLLLLTTDKTPESWDERANLWRSKDERKAPQKEETEAKRHWDGCRDQHGSKGVSEGGSKWRMRPN